MPAFLQELLSQVRAIWSRLDSGQRMTIGSVVLAALIGLGGIVWFASQPDYEVIHIADDPTSLDEAIRALSSSGIGFKEDGNKLLVERSESSRAHTSLLRAGVTGVQDPEASSDVASVTQDSASRRDALMVKRNRRAQRAVEQIDGVIRAYVTSSKPKRSVYSSMDGENQPSASVTLTLRSGQSFMAIARAAVHQVASTVGVPEEYVTAINARTKQTFSVNENGGVGGTEFLEQQRARSRELTNLAQQWLDRLYDGKAIVNVTVDLDPKFISSEEKIQAQNAILSEDTTKDSTSNIAASGSGGDPSVTGDSGAATRRGAGTEQKSETKRKTYEPFAGTRKVGMLTPDIRRMTVALVLDESIESSKHTDIESAIKRTVGFLESRPSGLSDEFTILQEKFPELPEIEPAAAFDPIDLAREFGPLAGQVFGILIVLLFLKRMLKTNASPRKVVDGEVSASLGGVSDGGSDGGMSASVLDENLDDLKPDERRRRLRREIERSINDDPAVMSRMLESWLAERKA